MTRGRPLEKTEFPNPDRAKRLTELFGSPANARRCLGLENTLSAAEVRDALAMRPVKPHVEQVLRRAWKAWCHRYHLPEELPGTFNLAMPPDYYEDLLP